MTNESQNMTPSMSTDDDLYETLARRLRIDKFKLHIEAAEQASFFASASEMSGMKKLEADKLKVRLEEKESELDLAIRKSPAEYGFEGKQTEKAISARITVDPDYKELRRRYFEAERESRNWASLVSALNQRSSMVKVLAELYISDYYGYREIDKDITPRTVEKGLRDLRRNRLGDSDEEKDG